MPNRRRFFVDLALVAAVATTLPLAEGGPAYGNREVSLDDIGLTDFLRQNRTWFSVRPSPVQAISLFLDQIETSPATSISQPSDEDALNEKFSLIFRGSSELRLEQNTYMFSHPRLGRFALFIVPIGSIDASSSYYEAVFNRPVPISETGVNFGVRPGKYRTAPARLN